MREIRFRAWDNKEKTFKNVNAIYFKNEGKIYSAVLDNNTYLIRKKEIEFLSYSGLKDKHGVEIYEGDIVKIDNEIYRVFYDDGSFRVIERESHLEHGRLFELMSMSDRAYCEVIGNIYQNGDLLK